MRRESESTETEFWNARYREEDYAYGEQPNTFLEAHAGLFEKGQSILSLAEGEGRNGVFLARQGCRVTGVDFSTAGRDKAMQLARKHGVALCYALADLTTYDMGENAWHGIVSIFCHLSTEERGGLFAAVKKALEPGGSFLLESYNKHQLSHGTGGPRDAGHLLALSEVSASFADWDIQLAREIERDVREGPYHHGLSAVTQFIAHKPR